MTTEEVKKMLEEDPDYIALKRFDHSLAKLLERYPDGCPDRIIANALMMTEDDIKARWDAIVEKLRKKMGVTL